MLSPSAEDTPSLPSSHESAQLKPKEPFSLSPPSPFFSLEGGKWKRRDFFRSQKRDGDVERMGWAHNVSLGRGRGEAAGSEPLRNRSTFFAASLSRAKLPLFWFLLRSAGFITILGRKRTQLANWESAAAPIFKHLKFQPKSGPCPGETTKDMNFAYTLWGRGEEKRSEVFKEKLTEFSLPECLTPFNRSAFSQWAHFPLTFVAVKKETPSGPISRSFFISSRWICVEQEREMLRNERGKVGMRIISLTLPPKVGALT